MKKDLLERINDRINAAVLENIPVEKIEYFEKLLDKGEEKEIQSFCQRNIFNLEEIIAKELVAFKKSYLG
jgi:hypothetical protein